MIRVWLGTFYQYLIQVPKVTMMMMIQILTEDYHEEWYSNSSESCRTSDEEIEIPQKRLKSENKRAVTNKLKRNLKVIFSTTYISNLMSIPTNFKRNVSPMFFNNNFRSADFSGVSSRPLSTVALLSLYFNFPRGWLRS